MDDVSLPSELIHARFDDTAAGHLAAPRLSHRIPVRIPRQLAAASRNRRNSDCQPHLLRRWRPARIEALRTMIDGSLPLGGYRKTWVYRFIYRLGRVAN